MIGKYVQTLVLQIQLLFMATHEEVLGLILEVITLPTYGFLFFMIT